MLACISAVSMMIPENEKRVEGPLIFDGFIGVLICSQRESMVLDYWNTSLSQETQL